MYIYVYIYVCVYLYLCICIHRHIVISLFYCVNRCLILINSCIVFRCIELPFVSPVVLRTSLSCIFSCTLLLQTILQDPFAQATLHTCICLSVG